MKARCSQSSSGYKNYAGRGIVVCERWLDFENFLIDMGGTFRESAELDRRDNNGIYEPNNCRWVTRAIQQRNRRNNHRVKIGDASLTLVEWQERSGIKANTILTRIRRGWPERRLLEISNQ